MKPGDYVIDPLGRCVLVLSIEEEIVIVRLAGSYGATIRYTKSMCKELNP